MGSWGSHHPRETLTHAHITFDQIRAAVARHEAATVARNVPKAAARRAVFELRSLLEDMGAADRADVLDLLKEELYGLPVTA